MSLLDDVRTTLDIVTPSEVTDKKCNLIIARGKRYLRGFAPDLSNDNFDDQTNAAYTLLLDYARYDYSNAVEMFKINFRTELIALRQEYEVRAAGRSEDDS